MMLKQVDNSVTKYKDEIQSNGKQNDSLTCFKCNKIFTTKGNLKSHMERHTGRSSFYCEMCNKGFNNLNHYKTHMQAHEGIKYHCQYCSKAFASKKVFSIIYHNTLASTGLGAIHAVRDSMINQSLRNMLQFTFNTSLLFS